MRLSPSEGTSLIHFKLLSMFVLSLHETKIACDKKAQPFKTVFFKDNNEKK